MPRTKADLEMKKAVLEQATNDWNRAQALWNTKTGALADTTYDQYKATCETAKANVEEDIANIKVAEATVAQDQAALDQCKTNLAYCTITSPVKGTIIDRRVNIGETVVSSLSSPSLFLIAKDLTKLEIWAAVNEADVGGIYAGATGQVHGGRLSEPDLRRGREPSAAQRHDDLERGDLHRGGQHRQQRRQAAALSHRQRVVRDGPERKRR